MKKGSPNGQPCLRGMHISVNSATPAGMLGRDNCQKNLLLLVINSHEHANKFPRNLAVVLVKALQICNKFHVRRLKA